MTALAPSSGVEAGGTSVTVTGTGFTGATGVSFGATAATSFTVVSDTEITAVSPPGTGVVDVTVTGPAGTSAVSAADQFTYTATAAGPVVIVTGSTVRCGGRWDVGDGDRYRVHRGDRGELRRDAGDQFHGGVGYRDHRGVAARDRGGRCDGDRSCRHLGGGPADQFTYATLVGAGPAVTALAPPSGVEAGGTSVTVTGTGFTGATGVSFGATAATSFTVVSDTEITAVSPPGTGMVDVTVTGPAGTSRWCQRGPVHLHGGSRWPGGDVGGSVVGCGGWWDVGDGDRYRVHWSDRGELWCHSGDQFHGGVGYGDHRGVAARDRGRGRDGDRSRRHLGGQPGRPVHLHRSGPCARGDRAGSSVG